MKKVDYATMVTNSLVPNNISTHTRQIHQSEVGANTNLPVINYTQTQTQMNDMGTNTSIPLNTTT